MFAAGGLKHCSCQCYSLPSSDSLIAKIRGKKNWLLLHLCPSITCPLGCSSVAQQTTAHLACSSREHSRKCHHFSSSVSIAPKWPISCLGCVFSRFYHPLSWLVALGTISHWRFGEEKPRCSKTDGRPSAWLKMYEMYRQASGTFYCISSAAVRCQQGEKKALLSTDVHAEV